MAASTTNKSTAGIRFKSGNHFLVKNGTGAWEGLGHVLGGKLEIARDSSSITLSDGETVTKATTRKGTFVVTLAQTDAVVLNKLFAIAGQTVKAYYFNGTTSSMHQEIYIPSLEVLEKVNLDMKGNQHQTLEITGNLSPADSGTASCTPNTDFPDEKKSTTATPVNSSNPYIVVVDTAVA